MKTIGTMVHCAPGAPPRPAGSAGGSSGGTRSAGRARATADRAPSATRPRGDGRGTGASGGVGGSGASGGATVALAASKLPLPLPTGRVGLDRLVDAADRRGRVLPAAAPGAALAGEDEHMTLAGAQTDVEEQDDSRRGADARGRRDARLEASRRAAWQRSSRSSCSPCSPSSRGGGLHRPDRARLVPHPPASPRGGPRSSRDRASRRARRSVSCRCRGSASTSSWSRATPRSCSAARPVTGSAPRSRARGATASSWATAAPGAVPFADLDRIRTRRSHRVADRAAARPSSTGPARFDASSASDTQSAAAVEGPPPHAGHRAGRTASRTTGSWSPRSRAQPRGTRTGPAEWSGDDPGPVGDPQRHAAAGARRVRARGRGGLLPPSTRPDAGDDVRRRAAGRRRGALLLLDLSLLLPPSALSCTACSSALASTCAMRCARGRYSARARTPS